MFRFGVLRQGQAVRRALLALALAVAFRPFEGTGWSSQLLIAASGEYLYCYNDIGHRHAIGHVNADAVRAVLLRREAMDAVASLCGQCNMRDRYRGSELIRAGLTYARTKLGMCNKLRAG